MRRTPEVGKVGEGSSERMSLASLRDESFTAKSTQIVKREADMPSLQGKLRVRKNTTSEKESVVTVTVAKNRAFGPWMLVDRKSKRQSRSQKLWERLIKERNRRDLR
ncbi:hypothetical protein GOBAR_DD12678 [Gossypium barbadense]|nr:hypothetical protein GOBAR_DD12678 [Gossypium barbadense]